MAISATMGEEIRRKALAGIPLTDPTPEKTAVYNMYVKNAAQNANTTSKAMSVALSGTTTSSSTSANSKAARQSQMDAFTGWDNDPAVRDLQVKDWHIYVDTGGWNSPEQIQLHNEAEQTRKYNNPTYTGLSNGPADWQQAEAITPRDTTPNADNVEGTLDSAINTSNWGSYLKIGVGGLLLIFMLSMFRK